ncbi:MAG TPA: hypothetical protein VIC33_01775 [Vicinamibacterales bacterium]
MLHRLVRHHRARIALLAALLPYVFTAVCVDFLHVHPQAAEAVICADHSVRSVEPVPTQDGQPFDSQQDPCPACVWLRISYRIEPGISITPSFQLLSEALPTPVRTAPTLAARQPASLRGPPPIAL